MSIFSSLNYLLKRAAIAIYQTKGSTETSFNTPSTESRPSNKLSLLVANKSSTINTSSFGTYVHFILAADEFSNIAEINSSLLTSTTKSRYLSSIPASIYKANSETEDEYVNVSDVSISNETFVDADLLYESWWNIFDERYLRHGWGWTITLIVAYMLILLVGVIGNVMVILVVSLRPQMRTVTNMFIMNLAVADFFVVVFCVPSNLLANVFAPWILGSFLCKAGAYMQGVSVCAAAYSLAAISLDRCQAIYRNLERPRGFSHTVCIRTVFIIWLSSILLTIPWAMMFTVKISEYDGLRNCVESWANEKLGNAYFLTVNFVCFYAIPLLLIFISNWIIYCHVTHRKVPQGSASSAPIRKLHRQTRHDVLKMLGIVTLTFLFSWLPLNILVIVIKFSENISESEYNVLGILMPIAQWLGSWNSSVNPILYAFLNKKFRRMFKSILPSWIPINSTGQYQGSTRTLTTAYPGRGFARSISNSKSDQHFSHQNWHAHSHNHTTLRITRFQEQTGKVATATVQTIPTKSTVTTVFTARTKVTIFDPTVIDRYTNKI